MENCIVYKFKVFSNVLACFLYFFDVVTDTGTALAFFNHNDYYWCIWTCVFIVLPWILQFAFFVYNCIQYEWSGLDVKYGFFFALTNTFPLWMRWCAHVYRRDRETREAILDHIVSVLTFIETVFEAYPQLCLQLYVASSTNRFLGISALSILCSFVSCVNGLGSGLTYFLQTRRGHEIRGWLVQALFYPWILGFLASFLPPMMLLAALKHHGGLSFLSFLLYAATHFYFTFYIGFLRPIEAGFRRQRCIHRLYFISLQLMFFGIVAWMAGCWYVSLASLDAYHPGITPNITALIPDFVWPEPLPTLFRPWIVEMDNLKGNETWTSCTKTVDEGGICVTDIAEVYYLIFNWLNCYLLFHHSLLVLLWPCLVKYCILDFSPDGTEPSPEGSNAPDNYYEMNHM